MRLSRRQRWALRAAALVAALAAVGPPLHEAAERSFAAHMAQHAWLVLVVAPLLALGWSQPPLLRALPRRARRRALAWPLVRTAWQRATSPGGAWVLHGAALWVWHLPVLFDAAVASEPVHALEHASFVGTAALFWWSLLRPGSAGYGAAVASLFTTALHTGALGALLTFVPRPLYRAYAGPAALEDQQLAGIIMWIPSGTVLLAAGLVFAAAWLREAGRRGAALDLMATSRER